jgi:hypothetical protein
LRESPGAATNDACDAFLVDCLGAATKSINPTASRSASVSSVASEKPALATSAVLASGTSSKNPELSAT